MDLLEVGVVLLSLLQGGLMAIDEWGFHRRRGLSWWELWGHPVDSFLYVLPLSVAALASATSGWLAIYLLLCVVSCLVITKDEWVHARECVPGEHWIHSLLFIVHPVVLGGGGYDVDARRGHRLETCLTGPDCGLRKLSNSPGDLGNKEDAASGQQ